MGALVMVIDDSLTVRKIMQASLQREGFQSASFRDGLQAMQALSSGDLPIPAAILIDVELPRLDGFQLVKLLRQQPAFAGVSILMLSGHSGLADRFRAWRAGASAYLTKPFQPQHVIEELRRRIGAVS